MNTLHSSTSLPSPARTLEPAGNGPAVRSFSPAPLQTRYALRVAAALTQRADVLEPDLSERLRVAREQALERARAARRTQAAAAPASRVQRSGGSAVLGGSPGRGGWWMKLAAVVPAVALVAGLMLIEQMESEAQIETAAEVDAQLLTDDLPPNAYSDAGFAEFLKAPRD